MITFYVGIETSHVDYLHYLNVDRDTSVRFLIFNVIQNQILKCSLLNNYLSFTFSRDTKLI